MPSRFSWTLPAHFRGGKAAGSWLWPSTLHPASRLKKEQRYTSTLCAFMARFTVLEALSQGWGCRGGMRTTHLNLVLRNEWSYTSAPRICLQASDVYKLTAAQDANVQLWVVRVGHGETAVCDEAVADARFLGENAYWVAQTKRKVSLGGRPVAFSCGCFRGPALCKDTVLPSEFRPLVPSVIRYAMNTKRRLRWSAFLH